MKVKTADLIRTALDWAVAKCEGYDPIFRPYRYSAGGSLKLHEMACMVYEPSTDPAQGYPILERERISLTHCMDFWEGQKAENVQFGPTMLIAGLRCFVASKLGDEVDIPEELCNAL